VGKIIKKEKSAPSPQPLPTQPLDSSRVCLYTFLIEQIPRPHSQIAAAAAEEEKIRREITQKSTLIKVH
jgi:hypothetical protein